MTSRLVRFAKRGASWEDDTTDEECLSLEFTDTQHGGGPDLRPSMYECEPHEQVRAYAEHMTLFEPDETTLAIDFSGLEKEVVATPGKPGFAFRVERHREMVLSDREVLLSVVQIVKNSVNSRADVIQVVAAMEYARGQLEERDPEWETASKDRRARRWLKRLRATSSG